MFLLNLLIFIVLVVIILIIVTQIVIPIKNGFKIFPIFKKNELLEKVESEQELVGILKQHNYNLSELQRLLLQKADLEKSIKMLEPPVEPPVEPLSTK